MSVNRGSSVGGLEVTSEGAALPPSFIASLGVYFTLDSEQWIGGAQFSGLHGLEFGGTLNYMVFPALDFSAGGAVAVVFNTDAVASTRTLFCATAHTDKRFILNRVTTEVRAGYYNNGGLTLVAGESSATVSTGTRYIAVVTYDGATTLNLRINGVDQSGTNHPGVNMAQLQTEIGGRGTGDYWDGRIAAVLAEVGTGVPWSAAEITAIEQWAMTKYGF